jgi:putative ABC transport system ATP-binding protein
MNNTASASVLRASGLCKHFGKGAALVHAVNGAGLHLEKGTTAAIMGPSGCGKSTLLHMLGGLERPSSGELEVAGQRISRMSEKPLARLRRTSIGFVFQAFQLMDELTATENVELPALLAGSAPRAARRRATALLERVGLADKAKSLPTEMSGGQKQRVAIARALINDPIVILADEPTGNLDSAATTEVLGLFEGLRSRGQAMVIVTHDPRVGATADRLLSMQDGVIVSETRPARQNRDDAMARREG